MSVDLSGAVVGLRANEIRSSTFPKGHAVHIGPLTVYAGDFGNAGPDELRCEAEAYTKLADELVALAHYCEDRAGDLESFERAGIAARAAFNKTAEIASRNVESLLYPRCQHCGERIITIGDHDGLCSDACRRLWLAEDRKDAIRADVADDDYATTDAGEQ